MSAQVVRAALLVAVVVVGELGHPPAAVYLLLLAGLGVTFPIPRGFRALVPLLVPRRLWDPSNAADSVSFDTAYILGPALAGATVTLRGRRDAIVCRRAPRWSPPVAAPRARAAPAGCARRAGAGGGGEGAAGSCRTRSCAPPWC